MPKHLRQESRVSSKCPHVRLVSARTGHNDRTDLSVVFPAQVEQGAVVSGYNSLVLLNKARLTKDDVYDDDDDDDNKKSINCKDGSPYIAACLYQRCYSLEYGQLLSSNVGTNQI